MRAAEALCVFEGMYATILSALESILPPQSPLNLKFLVHLFCLVMLPWRCYISPESFLKCGTPPEICQPRQENHLFPHSGYNTFMNAVLQDINTCVTIGFTLS